MQTRPIDGTAIARELRGGLLKRAAALSASGVRAGLAVIRVGSHAASSVYVRNKIKASDEAGIYSQDIQLPDTAGESTLLGQIRTLNNDPRIHGILVQLPLPPGFSSDRVFEAISPLKDVDGFHPTNIGLLAIGHPRFVPCTPLGVMKLLDHERIDPEGRRAVVVGRSNIVGKPMALLLLQRGATVTICNSKTPDLGSVTREAEILVVAAGKPKLVDAKMVRAGAIVIDVGINRLADGKLAGDVDYDSVFGTAARVTPVPGGVGPMTIAMLLENTIASAERALAARLGA
ncbi:MAG TPA: tetrahydrofolate dehydrogenase/cyclohydrolase catalytic domain-containing protein [Burkholderiales bacterium]|jgi:methylenetetrahydrofolate dehydrogenase (NADP+)/methenyltetrahydrofolate cyclohydrolase|nr:tetrahydrofolate dehydrogenase/cyclohydrolase catalytic domain-containing protein [Burkholderiales bacterium]